MIEARKVTVIYNTAKALHQHVCFRKRRIVVEQALQDLAFFVVELVRWPQAQPARVHAPYAWTPRSRTTPTQLVRIQPRT